MSSSVGTGVPEPTRTDRTQVLMTVMRIGTALPSSGREEMSKDVNCPTRSSDGSVGPSMRPASSSLTSRSSANPQSRPNSISCCVLQTPGVERAVSSSGSSRAVTTWPTWAISPAT